VTGSIWTVAVPIIVWLGVFTYTVMVDRRLAVIEAKDHEEEH